MANPRRNAKPGVADLLQKETWRFSFLQANRLLRQIAARWGNPHGELGTDIHPDEEYVRLVSCPSRTFPGAEVLQLVRHLPPGSDESAAAGAAANGDSSGDAGAEKGSPVTPQMVTTFMGLYGPQGVLPWHDTQRIINSISRSGLNKNQLNAPEKEFLDLLTHRILSLFYRASIKYRAPLSYEATLLGGREDLFTRSLYSIAGFGTGGLRNRQLYDDSVNILYASLHSTNPKNALSLMTMLADVFQVPVRIEQFSGQWLELDSDSRSWMPTRQNPDGLNCSLGQSFIIGDRIWDVQGKFRIHLGPLNYAEFETFLSGSPRLNALAQLVRTAVGIQFDFDVQLELLAVEIPQCELRGVTRLGQNSWLITRTPDRNSTDAVMAVDGFPLTQQLAG